MNFNRNDLLSTTEQNRSRETTVKFNKMSHFNILTLIILSVMYSRTIKMSS